MDPEEVEGVWGLPHQSPTEEEPQHPDPAAAEVQESHTSIAVSHRQQPTTAHQHTHPQPPSSAEHSVDGQETALLAAGTGSQLGLVT